MVSYIQPRVLVLPRKLGERFFNWTNAARFVSAFTQPVD
jgi:hypothetical protein